ncbi:MAG: anaerobic sulfite reductase subunit [Clostridia bacterium]|nr:anaerobic sulfite reductase subunit [Clostridia bacterium]
MIRNPYMPQEAEILKIFQETDIDYTFRLKTDLKVKSGQFLEVSIPRIGEAPISVSDFGDGYLDLTIRKVGRVTQALHNLQPGDKFFIRGPYGNGFPIDKLKDRRLIVAAGGTGLAPVKSLINQYYNDSLEIKSLQLLAGFKSPGDILFSSELEKWSKKFPVEITVDRGSENWKGRVGLVTKLVADLDISEVENTMVIVVGPPLMMKFTTQEFVKKKISIGNIYLSFERKMSCGIGKCGHCKIDDTYVCLEGPVFEYSKAIQLLD